MTENRIRDALRDHTAAVDTRPPDWNAVEAKAAEARRRQRAQRITLTGLAAAAAIVAIVLAAAALRDERSEQVRTDEGVTRTTETPTTEPTSTTSTEPTTTTTTVVIPDPATVDGIYPDRAAYQRQGAAAFSDPVATAKIFAKDWVGMPAPLAGAFQPTGTAGDSGTVSIRPNPRASITSIVTLKRVTPDGPWTVTGARAEQIRLDSPKRLARITSPVPLSGEAFAFEGHVRVEVREDGMRAGAFLGEGFVIGGGDQMRPFGGEVAFKRPTKTAGALLLMEPSAEDGSPLSFTVIRVRF